MRKPETVRRIESTTWMEKAYASSKVKSPCFWTERQETNRSFNCSVKGTYYYDNCLYEFCWTFVPPFVIFPLKNMSDVLMKVFSKGFVGKVHPSGWIESNPFTEWFAHFIQKLKLTNPFCLFWMGITVMSEISN